MRDNTRPGSAAAMREHTTAAMHTTTMMSTGTQNATGRLVNNVRCCENVHPTTTPMMTPINDEAMTSEYASYTNTRIRREALRTGRGGDRGQPGEARHHGTAGRAGRGRT